MKNATEILIIVDESGSMGHLREEVISQFNTFIQEQKQDTTQCYVSLLTFNSRVKRVFNRVPLQEVPELTEESYIPNSMTSLLDAIGEGTTTLGKQLSELPEEERPNKVIVVVITDGKENASREYKSETVFDMVKHQKEKYNWEYLFIGANIDVIKEASQIGIDQGSTMAFAATQSGYRGATQSVTATVSKYRKTGTVDKDWNK